jgi:hypothetical protein
MKFNISKKYLIIALFTISLSFLISFVSPKADFVFFLVLLITCLYFTLNVYLGLIFSLRIKKPKLRTISILGTIVVNIFIFFILISFFIGIVVNEFYFPDKPKIINRLIFLLISLFLPIFWFIVSTIQKRLLKSK